MSKTALKNRNTDLKELWKKYEDKFESSDLKEVVKRRFVYSEFDEYENIILIIGINPSFRKGETNMEESSFKFSEVLKDRYFGKIFTVLPNPSKFNYEYTDLFYLRQTEQASLKDFLQDTTTVGLTFMCEQLAITQRMIEAIKPKLIIVFNKSSWHYWGKEYKAKKDTNTWMGYRFEEKGKLHFIEGFVESKERVKGVSGNTNLKGTPVYFSKYLKYLSSSEIEKIQNDLKQIITNL